MTNTSAATPDHEIEPPWIKYPGFPPADTFWRQAGEYWFCDIWKPYWDALSPNAKTVYLARWNVPDDWSRFYFDEGFRTWLDSVGDE
jgi:hypothetical protein